MMRVRALAAAVAALLLSMPLPAQAARDELVIGMSQYPANFNPNIDAMAAKSYVLGMAQRPITVHDADWQLVCMLCTQLPTIENGRAKVEPLPGGKTGVAVTYSLRPDAKWGDGTPITSRDVVFTAKVGKHPQSGVTHVEFYERLKAVDVKDDKTFTLHFDKLAFDYNAINDFRLLPAHLEEAVFDADPKEYRNRSKFETDTTNPGLWFGPYRPTEVVRGAHVVMEPNPNWWGQKPNFKRIVLKTVESSPALEANLVAGSVDYIPGELGITPDRAVVVEGRVPDRVTVVYKPSLVYEHLEVNLDNPALADLRVRKALLLGLDREALNQQLFQGKLVVANSPVSPLDWVFAKDVPGYGFDERRANQLLDEAGWTRGTDGKRRNAKGEPLSLIVMTTAGNRNREVIQLVIQAAWKRLGIDVVLKNEPSRQFFSDTVQKRNFPHLALFAWYSAPESVPRSTLHSSVIPSAANHYAGQNLSGYVNPRMDALLDQIEGEMDKGKRKELWRQLQVLYAEDLPALPLFWRTDAFVMPKWLKGVVPTGHQYPSTLWVEQWKAE